jgi:hypothetical protein
VQAFPLLVGQRMPMHYQVRSCERAKLQFPAEQSLNRSK